MSIQVAVRLPDPLVDQVDRLVAAGAERSRASLIERALERELRRLRTEQEVAILAGTGADPDRLAALAEHASATRLDID